MSAPGSYRTRALLTTRQLNSNNSHYGEAFSWDATIFWGHNKRRSFSQLTGLAKVYPFFVRAAESYLAFSKRGGRDRAKTAFNYIGYGFGLILMIYERISFGLTSKTDNISFELFSSLVEDGWLSSGRESMNERSQIGKDVHLG